jgi:hypothetical protein
MSFSTVIDVDGLRSSIAEPAVRALFSFGNSAPTKSGKTPPNHIFDFAKTPIRPNRPRSTEHT